MMKTLTRKLVSTMPENYGEVIQELSIEVPDDYEERGKETKELYQQITAYYARNETNTSSLQFVTSIAVISGIVSLIAILLSRQ